MRRETLLPVLASSAAAVALVALVYSIVPPESPSAVALVLKGEARQGSQSSQTDDKELNESIVVVPPQSSDGNRNHPVAETPSGAGFAHEPATRHRAREQQTLADENAVRKMVAEYAMREIPQVYSVLLEHLGLAPKEKDALLALLIEIEITEATTPYSRGKTMNEQVRSDSIAAVIGDAKLQDFLALERNLIAYAEAGKIESLFQRNGVPLSGAQREGLLKILIEVGDEYRPAASFSDLESLERVMTHLDEYQRHVIELAPSALSPNQVVYLFEQYQHGSYRRASVLEAQQRWRAEHPGQDSPLYYPLD